VYKGLKLRTIGVGKRHNYDVNKRNAWASWFKGIYKPDTSPYFEAMKAGLNQ